MRSFAQPRNPRRPMARSTAGGGDSNIFLPIAGAGGRQPWRRVLRFSRTLRRCVAAGPNRTRRTPMERPTLVRWLALATACIAAAGSAAAQSATPAEPAVPAAPTAPSADAARPAPGGAMREHRQSMTPEQRAAARERMKAHWESMTPEEREAAKKRLAERRAGRAASAPR
jgi:hypothetical protein